MSEEIKTGSPLINSFARVFRRVQVWAKRPPLGMLMVKKGAKAISEPSGRILGATGRVLEISWMRERRDGTGSDRCDRISEA